MLELKYWIRHLMLRLGHLIYLILKAMEFDKVCTTIAMLARSGLQMLILISRSKKPNKSSEQLWQGFQLCLVRNRQRLVSLYFILGSTSLGISAKDCSWFFSSRTLEQKVYLVHVSKNTCQVSQAMNEYLPFKLFWVGFYFSPYLNLHHMHWFCLLECECVTIA